MTEGKTFAMLGLSEARLAAVEALGWERPTPIQFQAIPAALAGREGHGGGFAERRAEMRAGRRVLARSIRE